MCTSYPWEITWLQTENLKKISFRNTKAFWEENFLKRFDAVLEIKQWKISCVSRERKKRKEKYISCHCSMFLFCIDPQKIFWLWSSCYLQKNNSRSPTEPEKSNTILLGGHKKLIPLNWFSIFVYAQQQKMKNQTGFLIFPKKAINCFLCWIDMTMTFKMFCYSVLLSLHWSSKWQKIVSKEMYVAPFSKCRRNCLMYWNE